MKFIKRTHIDEAQIIKTAENNEISPLLAELLISRGITTSESIHKFLYGTIHDFSSPYSLKNMDDAVKILNNAISQNKNITIYGDYDCDGVGAISIIYLALKDIGYTANYYIPVRASEGYGLNNDAIKTIKEKFNTDILLTVDCGINSIAEIEYATSLGMTVIVTDHHQPGQILPNCIVINPAISTDITPLCGAGVAFYLISALINRDIAMKYIDICAISTIADIVPLIGDNRLIVKLGINAIQKGKTRPGIKELLYSAKINLKTVTANDIGYKIAPRINAAGRLENAQPAVNLFIENDITLLHLLADKLTLLNTQRQEMNTIIYNEALSMLKHYDFSKYKIIMLEGNWLEGIVGIVCAKLAEYFNLPVILLCRQNNGKILKGSARSIPGLNLFELFEKNNSKLISYGGHEMAAGICFETQFFDYHKNIFNNYIINNINSETFKRKIYYDKEIPINEIDNRIITDVNILEPFGHKNRPPVFLDNTNKTKFKRINNTQHIKAVNKVGTAIAFNKAQQLSVSENNLTNILYTIDRNYYNGRIYPQFSVKEYDIESFDISETDMIENFCKTFLKHEINGDILQISKNNSDFPTLYVSFNKHNIEHFLKDNTDINIVLFENQRCDITNTLAICPNIDFPYYFYSKIIFLDSVGNELLNNLKSYNKNFEIKNIPNFVKVSININTLRNLYILLKEQNINDNKFTSYVDVYNYLNAYLLNNTLDKCEFIIGCYIFEELNLIKYNKDGIIYLVNKRTDLNNSKLYKYFAR